MLKIATIILAAGKGTRMKSDLTKVLHTVCLSPMIKIVFDVARDFGSNHIHIVTSSENCEDIKKVCGDFDFVSYSIQKERLGTGHAVLSAFLDFDFSSFDKVIILCGDSPLVTVETLAGLNFSADLCFLGFETSDSSSCYGRMKTFGDRLLKIVEFKDASDDEKEIKLCNSGVVCGSVGFFMEFLPKLKNDNSQKEYYLTDLCELGNDFSKTVVFATCKEDSVLGVNSMMDLAVCNKKMQNRLRLRHMSNGVFLPDPDSVYFALDSEIANNVCIEPNVFFGRNVKVSSYCVIKACSYLEDVQIGERVQIGPFARIRGSSVIEGDCKIGNFVEVKNSHFERGTKAGHLSYIGDATVGFETNIGAGAVFCNYDGLKKHKTVIGNNCFVGSNSSLVAPLFIANKSVIAAGSVVTDDVLDEESLVIARSRQIVKKRKKS